MPYLLIGQGPTGSERWISLDMDEFFADKDEFD